MHSFLPSKAMGKLLRQALAERNIGLSHSECLELVARQYGLANWNILAAMLAEQPASPLDTPDDWFVTGNTDRKAYRLGLDPSSPGCALIESLTDRRDGLVEKAEQFACMMQSIVASDYLGRKVRLTASIRTEDADLGTIWMRVDKEPGSVLRFDNMMDREQNGPIKATTGWTERSVVLDVPDEATSIHYGFFLKGFGRVWARAFRLEAVGEDAVTTDRPRQVGSRQYLQKPSNLNFSRRSGSAA